MAERRPLTFQSLDQIMPDVDRLLEGHTTAGNWSLGQICNHFSRGLRMSVEGAPTSAPWIVRNTLGRFLIGRILSTGQMREGIKVPEKFGLTPGPQLDDRAEAEALRGALRFYAGVRDAFPEHPFFGPLTRPQWDRLHCIHCAHHLSFAWPAVNVGATVR